MERMITKEVKSRYPLTTSDLTEEEVEVLTGILAINNPAPHQISRPDFPENVNNEIKTAISSIQPVLRRSRFIHMLPATVGREAKLCATHEDLNPFVIGHLYELLQAEVTDRVDTVDNFADRIQDTDRVILRSVQALRRLWGEAPPDEVRQLPINYPHPQGNGCEACTLARVVQDPGYLRYLRTAILSRTYCRTGAHLPRLLCFAHTAIHTGHARLAGTIMAESDEMAAGFKITRKNTSTLSRRNRRSFEDVEPYLRGQPEQVHPAIREEMFQREQDHHNRYRRERQYGSHVAHRHSVHCQNARQNRHSANCPRNRNRSRRDTITDNVTPQFQNMSLNERQSRPSNCGMNCSTRHSHAPPVARHVPPTQARPVPRQASTSHRSSMPRQSRGSHRSSASRQAPPNPGSYARQVERREADEDALVAQYTHLVNHNAAYGWDTDDSDASSVEIP